MQPRQGLTEIFSTFVQFEMDRFCGWITDPKLRRSMNTCLKGSMYSESERFWVIYWYKVWQTQASPLAIKHITAYLQEVCYWVAWKMATKTPGSHQIADFFQTAIAGVHKILKGFNPHVSSNLKSYAEFAFGNLIKDTIRQRREADVCTDWALLNKLSHRQLVLALQQAGLSSTVIARYSLVWRCFQELHAPSDPKTTRSQSQPDPFVWEAIARLYNSERFSQPDLSGAEGSPEQIKTWLLTCAKAVRTFLYPTLTSINVSPSESEGGELIDILPANLHESLLADLIAQEEADSRQALRVEMNHVLRAAIANLDLEGQALLQAYYQEGLNQQQIAHQLGLQQFNISRRLARLRRTLLLNLARWSQDHLHLPLQPDVIDAMSNLLEEWLVEYYRPSESSSH